MTALYVAVLNHASSSCGGALHDGRRSGQIERARIKTLKVTLVMGKNGVYAEKQACTHALMHSRTHARSHINIPLQLVHVNINSSFISKITAIISNVCYIK